MTLILASGSKTRQDLLVNAGIDIQPITPLVDERAVKESLILQGVKAIDLAYALAELKAQAVSRLYPDAMIIGADQLLTLDGQFLSKAQNIQEAQNTLKLISDKQHQLISAAIIVQNGQVIWRGYDRAKLWVRPLSDEFIDTYLNLLGDKAFNSVGCYHLEGLGAQLMQKIDGDYFTILGLPLLSMMQFFRDHSFIQK